MKRKPPSQVATAAQLSVENTLKAPNINYFVLFKVYNLSLFAQLCSNDIFFSVKEDQFMRTGCLY